MKANAWAIAAALSVALPVAAQQYVYPAKGQSPEQQKKDDAACKTWATQQTGFDPAKPPPPPAAAQPAPVTGSGSRARGAAAGAVIGGATGGDAGDAAVVGAAVAGSAQRRENRRAAGAQNQAAAQQVQAGQDAYMKARSACLEGRGYTVK